MSASTVDAGTLEVVDLQGLFEEPLTCEVCDKEAKWRLVASCGHAALACDYHAAKEMIHFKRNYPNTVCHVNKDLVVTDLKKEPL